MDHGRISQRKADAVARRAAARPTHVAGQRLQGERSTVVLLAVAGPPRSITRDEVRGSRSRITARQARNGVGGNVAQRGRPARVLAQSAVGLLQVPAVGLRADREPFDEAPILEPFFQDHVRHGHEHRGIRAGPDRDPLAAPGRGRVGVDGVHADNRDARVAGLLQEHLRGRAEMRVRRVPAPGDDQPAVEEIRAVGAVGVLGGPLLVGEPQRVLHREVRAFPGRRRPPARESAVAGEQHLQIERRVEGARSTAADPREDRGRAMPRCNLPHARRDRGERLVPTDCREPPLAATPDTPHGREDAIGRIDPGPVGASARAGAKLPPVGTVVAVAMSAQCAIVSRDVAERAVAHVHLHQAAPATVVIAGAGQDAQTLLVRPGTHAWTCRGRAGSERGAERGPAGESEESAAVYPHESRRDFGTSGVRARSRHSSGGGPGTDRR